jgi:hypothetical protein
LLLFYHEGRKLPVDVGRTIDGRAGYQYVGAAATTAGGWALMPPSTLQVALGMDAVHEFPDGFNLGKLVLP